MDHQVTLSHPHSSPVQCQRSNPARLRRYSTTLDDIDTRLLLATTLLQQHPVLSISYTPTIDVVIIHIKSTLRFSDLRRASSNVCGLRYHDRPWTITDHRGRHRAMSYRSPRDSSVFFAYGRHVS